MTTRRSFFSRLLGTVAAITVASAVEVFGIVDELPKYGHWVADFKAAYEPITYKFGYVIRINRLPASS